MQDIGALYPLGPRPARVDNPSFDVVLVHGRGIDADKTWASLWSEHCVENNEQRELRVFTFTYQDRVNNRYRPQSIRLSAEKLLQDLIRQRSVPAQEMRPIMFVGHSTGGVIIKQALITARHDPRFRNIAYSACATIFLATPHRGYKDVIQRIFNADSLNLRLGIQAPPDLVCDDDDKSLNIISTEFLHLYQGDLVFRNHTEGKAPPGLDEQIVEEQNAALDQGMDCDILEKQLDHFQICTFDIATKDGPRWLMSLIDQVKRDSPKFKAAMFSHNRYRLFQLLRIPDILLPCPPSPVIPTQGTCNWIQEQGEFKEWLSGPENHRKLWITGGLGCGKTFLAEHIRLIVMNEDDRDLVIHFSLESMKEGLITPRRMLACLIHSILVNYPMIPVKFANRKWDQHVLLTDDDIELLWRHTIAEITTERRLILIVDEMDRVSDNQDQMKLGPVLRAMSGETNPATIKPMLDCNKIRVLVLSRLGGDHHEPLLGWGPSEYQIPQNKTKGDIKKTVEEELDRLAKHGKLDHEAKAGIGKRIRTIAGDMYILAHLALNEITSTPGKTSVPSLQNSIAGFYDHILNRLTPGGQGLEKPNRFLRDVLFWMTYQGHAMNEVELELGLAMVFRPGFPAGSESSDSYQGVVDEGLVNNPQTGHTNLKREILLNCAPLVKFRSDGRFEPVHRTLKEFLATSPETFARLANLTQHKNYAFDDQTADEIISLFCMDYLLLSFFGDAGKRDLTPEEWVAKVEQRIDDHEFVTYAARHWVYHAKLSSKPFKVNLSDMDSSSSQYHLLNFSEPHALCWAEVWWYYTNWTEGDRFPGSHVKVPNTRILRRRDRSSDLNLARHLATPSGALRSDYKGPSPVLNGPGPAPNPPAVELPAEVQKHEGTPAPAAELPAEVQKNEGSPVPAGELPAEVQKHGGSRVPAAELPAEVKNKDFPAPTDPSPPRAEVPRVSPKPKYSGRSSAPPTKPKPSPVTRGRHPVEKPPAHRGSSNQDDPDPGCCGCTCTIL